MERIIKALSELQKINSAYELSNITIEGLLKNTDHAKVCTPIIGKFSSGKSALVNTILGYSNRILKEDITPETAVPVEILYSAEKDSVFVVGNDDTFEEISVSDFRSLEVDASAVKCVRLNLRNCFLEKIPDVMLVDMPGFESGYEVHNKAIDNYLPQSLAYIIAFPADDMIVRSSIGNILKELCLHDMPLCVVITKFDKCNDDFEETLAAMKERLKSFVGEREITYCCTSSYSGDSEEVEKFLVRIQRKSQGILVNKFRNAVLSVAETTESYLNTIVKSSAMSESQLDEQEEKLKKQLESLSSRFAKEKDSFNLQLAECVEEIKRDVQTAMESEESTLIAMAMNSQSINEHLNLIVRNAVTTSVKRRFIPKVEKYLKRVANCINSEAIGDVHISFHFNMEDVSTGMVSTAVAAATAILVAGPIIGGIIAGIIAFANKLRGDKKREEAKSQIKIKLSSEVYPQVLKEVAHGIEIAITKQLTLINTSIEEEIVTQRTTLEKAMEDVRKQITEEKEYKENLAIDIKADLERISVIKNEL